MMMMTDREKEIKDVLSGLIYHGRHFVAFRDEIVLGKTIDYIMGLFKKWAEEDNAKRRAR